MISILFQASILPVFIVYLPIQFKIMLFGLPISTTLMSSLLVFVAPLPKHVRMQDIMFPLAMVLLYGLRTLSYPRFC